MNILCISTSISLHKIASIGRETSRTIHICQRVSQFCLLDCFQVNHLTVKLLIGKILSSVHDCSCGKSQCDENPPITAHRPPHYAPGKNDLASRFAATERKRFRRITFLKAIALVRSSKHFPDLKSLSHQKHHVQIRAPSPRNLLLVHHALSRWVLL